MYPSSSRGVKLRMPRYVILAFLILLLTLPAGLAGELRIAAWNLEHLDDTDGKGCLDRTGADYAAIARQVEALNADIVAVQEVENVAAAQRVFPASHWDVAISSRPPIEDPGAR